MNTKMMIELFGYLGSALVVVSMLMTSVMKLRIINTVGSVIFAIYALIIRSYPTALMNLFLVGINIYHMLRLRNTTKHFDLLEITPEDEYLEYLLDYYRNDIAKYFPEFSKDRARDASFVRLVLCDSVTAGIFAAVKEEKDLHVLLDYSLPVYRDCSVGTFLYGRLGELGTERLISGTGTREHMEYLEKMGFRRDAGDLYVKDLRNRSMAGN